MHIKELAITMLVPYVDGNNQILDSAGLAV